MKTKKRAVSILVAAVMAFSALTVGFSAGAADVEVFTDSLTDLSKVYQQNGTFQRDDNTKPGGDPSVAVDYGYYETISENGAMTLLPSLVWKVNGGAKVEAFVYLWTDYVTGDFTFSWSADGEAYTDITDVTQDAITLENAEEKGVGDEVVNGDASMKLYTIAKVDETAKYLKVTWPQMSASFPAQISMFRATGGAPAAITDITADTIFSTVLADQAATVSGWNDYSKDKFDWDEKIGGAADGEIPMIILEYGKTVAPETYVTYKVKAGSPFMLKYARHVGVAEDTRFKLYSSEDKNEWTELTDVIHSEVEIVTADGGETGYWENTEIVEAIPATHKYVKAVWPDVGNVNYGIGLISAKFNKTDEMAQEDDLTEIVVTAVEKDDTAAWADYSKNKFQWNQKVWLNGENNEPNIPFVIVSYDKAAAPNAYVTYEVKAGSAFVLNYLKHDTQKTLGDMKLYSSADGAEWTAIDNVVTSNATIFNEDGTTNNYYRVISRVEAIPAEHTYVKVEWPELNDSNTWAIGLTSVKLMRPDPIENPEDPIVPDATEELDKIKGETTIAISGDKDTDTKKMDSYTKDALDFGQVLQIGEENIPVLMLDEDFVEGKSELPEISVVYQVKANSPLKVQSLTHQYALNMDLKFQFMVSKDGKEWTALSDVLYTNTVIEETKWLSETYGVASLGDVSYVKIVWPNQKDYTNAIDPVSGDILDSLSYAPALVSLSFNEVKADSDDNSGVTAPEQGSPSTGVAVPLAVYLTLALSSAACVWSKRRG